MKTMRLVALFLMIAALLVQADSNVVSSANVVGYVQTDIVPGQYLLAGVNFTASGEEPTLKEVVGTNQLREASNYLEADRVVVFDADAAVYQAYAMYDGDHEFYPCNTLDEWNTGSATNPVLPVGSGFWILPASGSTTTNSIYLDGDAVLDASKDIALLNGYQLIAYPFSSDQAIATLNTSNLTAHANYLEADRIVTFSTGQYQAYGLYTDANWYPCNTLDEWNNAIAETDYVIAVGEGFWFIAYGGKTTTEPNKYLGNL